jgi:hypothetical protein
MRLYCTDLKDDLDNNCLKSGFIVKKQANVNLSDFSFDFLNDCKKGEGMPYFTEEILNNYAKNKSKENIRWLTFGISFGSPNENIYGENGEYEYMVDMYLAHLKNNSIQVSSRCLYMITSEALLHNYQYGDDLTKSTNLQEYSISSLSFLNKRFLYLLYIGKTDNLYARWKNHHRRNEMNFLCRLDLDLMLFMYSIEDNVSDDEFSEMEKILIREINPPMNGKIFIKDRIN